MDLTGALSKLARNKINIQKLEPVMNFPRNLIHNSQQQDRKRRGKRERKEEGREEEERRERGRDGGTKGKYNAQP